MSDLYRRLLTLLPPSFRDRYGDDMAADVEDRLAEAAAAGSGRQRLLCAALADLVLTAAAEWPRALAPARARGPHHDMHRTRRSTMDAIGADLRGAVRALRRYPVVSTVAVLTLALGIGANTAVFSLVHTLLLEPLPYRDAERLVLVWPDKGFNKSLVRRVEQAMPALDGMVGISNWTFTLTGDPEPEEVLGSLVSPGYFELLGVQPALGRGFRPEEGQSGRNGVVVLGHELWQRRFGGDPSILGRSIPLAGDDLVSRTVIGVMPPGYRPITGAHGAPQFWVPLTHPESWNVSEDNSWYVNWRVARLAPRATVEEARAQLRAEARRMRGEGFNNVDEESARTAEVLPLTRERAAEVGRPLWLLMAVVGLVLLIACGNVANLLLARGEGRERELGVRRALGAGGPALARQLLLESLVLGVAGGACGVLVAWGLVRLLVRVGTAEVPRLAEVGLDAPVLLFALLSSLAAAALFGALPALRGVRRAIAPSVRRSAAGALGVGRGRHLPSWLVAGEVALAVVVAVASGLMLRSLHALYSVEPGLRASGVLALKVSPPGSKYADAVAFNGFYDRVFERLARVPGVRRTGAIQLLPLTEGDWGFPGYVEGHALGPGETPPRLSFRVIRPGWFETVGIPLRSGRHLRDGDGLGDAPDLAVVNETLARRFWPNDPLRGPLGREIRLFGTDGPAVRVVGVVGDVRQHALDAEIGPELHVTAQEWTWPVSLWLAVRVDGDPLAAAPALRRAIWEVDRDAPISSVMPLEDVVARSAGMRRFLGVLLAALGLLALALGAVGVFGVTTYTVARRVPELGLRKALGATTGGLLRATVRQGMRPVAAGVVLGAAAALAAGQAIAAHLYGVTARDPWTLLATSLLLLGVGAAATALPAWRGSSVDPVRALREE